MQKENFGIICASLRNDILNMAAGRNWSQQDLADATDLPLKVIGQIERGEKVNLHSELLICLADAFNLTTTERKRFFSLASDITNEEVARDDQSISTVFDATVQEAQQIRQPVLLHDGIYRIIGLNTAYMQTYGLTSDYLGSIPESDPTKYHFVRHIHDEESPVRHVYKSQIEKVEMNNAVYWRFLSIAHRHDPLFNEIQDKLLSQYPRFAYLWNSLSHRFESVDASSLLRNFYCNHPNLGLLRYLIVSTQLYSGERELFMTQLSPTDHQTFSMFNKLIEDKKFEFVCFDPMVSQLEEACV